MSAALPVVWLKESSYETKESIEEKVRKAIPAEHSVNVKELHEIAEKLWRELDEAGYIKLIQGADSEEGEENDGADRTKRRWKFVFVGVVVFQGCVLKCLPKYCSEKESFEKILRVLDKLQTNSIKERIVEMFSERRDDDCFDFLSLLLFLLRDYYEAGIYTNEKNIIESNGSGEILWDRTVNDTMAVLSGGRPYYIDLRTKKHIADEFDYFKLLHEFILTDASRQLDKADLLETFGLEGVEFSSEDIERENFGERDYILYRLEQELNWQFNTRKQLLLKAMHAYISLKETLWEDDSGLTVFGTANYHVVWEKVCAEVLGNVLEEKMDNLCRIYRWEVPKRLLSGTLKEAIEKPAWTIGGEEYRKSHTLIPDTVTVLDNKDFFIFDAKYYMPEFDEKGMLKRQPGIGDVTKQFLYQLAFRRLLQDNDLVFRNCFLFPWEGDGDNYVDETRIGSVSMEMFTDPELNLEPVQVRFLSAPKVYEHYLAGIPMANVGKEVFLEKMRLSLEAIGGAIN